MNKSITTSTRLENGGSGNPCQSTQELEREWFAQGKVRTAPWAVGAETIEVDGRAVALRQLHYPELYTGPRDRWIDVWALAELRHRKSGEYQGSPDALQVCAAFDGRAQGIERATTLDAWPKVARELRPPAVVKYGLVAVGVRDVHPDLIPGITLALESPLGGQSIALQVLQDLMRRGIGAVMGWTEDKGRWGLLRILHVPGIYTVMGMEQSLGIDWRQWECGPPDPQECKRIWCEHVALAVRQIISGLPALLVEDVSFDLYAATDRLGELSPAEIMELTRTRPEKLAAALLRLNHPTERPY